MKFVRKLYDEFYYPWRIKKNYSINPVRVKNELLESQYWDRKKIEQYQEVKLNEILRHAQEKIPFYNNKWAVKQWYSLEDIKNIPSITKADIKEKSELFHDQLNSKLFKHTTSGSTGDPLVVFSDGFSEANRLAQRLRFYQWWNIYPSDKNVLVWGKKDHPEKQPEKFWKKLVHKAFQQQYFINVFNLNNDSISTIFHQLVKFKPVYIRGYKSAIHQMARLLNHAGLDGTVLNLKAVITTSEILFEEERLFIEKVFNVKVVDEFGAAEIGLFSYQCPRGSNHICEELNYLFTNDKNELFVTDLHNKSMPIINYKIGDRIKISNNYCSCGRTSRIIDEIEGRLNCDVRKDNGEEISQYIFYYAVKELDDINMQNSILKYKVLQKDNHFDFYIEPGANFSQDVLIYLKQRMKKDIGATIDIDFHVVDNIPLDKSGKLQFFRRIK